MNQEYTQTQRSPSPSKKVPQESPLSLRQSAASAFLYFQFLWHGLRFSGRRYVISFLCFAILAASIPFASRTILTYFANAGLWTHELASAVTLWIAWGFFHATVLWLRNASWSATIRRRNEELHEDLVALLASQSPQQAEGPLGARVRAHLTVDLARFDGHLPWSLLDFLCFGLEALVFLFLSLSHSPWLLPAALALGFLTARAFGAYRRDSVLSRSQLTELSAQRAQELCLASISPLALTGDPTADSRYQRWESLVEKQVQLQQKIYAIERRFGMQLPFLTAVLLALFLFPMLALVQRGEVSASTAAVFISFSVWFPPTMSWVLRSFSAFLNHLHTADRIFQTRQSHAPAESQKSFERHVPVRRPAPEEHNVLLRHDPELAIAFEKVDLGYGAEAQLKGITFAVKQGEIAALVGPSGSGKSTVLRVLVGDLEPMAGKITVLGKGLSAWKPDALRKEVHLISQGAPLFSGSGYFNVCPDDSLSHSEITEILTSYGFPTRFVRSLAQNVGASGTRLARSDRAFYCLARALIARSPVLLLDELAAGLDAETGACLLSIITHAREGRTILLASHEPQFLALASTKVELGTALCYFNSNSAIPVT